MVFVEKSFSKINLIFIPFFLLPLHTQFFCYKFIFSFFLHNFPYFPPIFDAFGVRQVFTVLLSIFIHATWTTVPVPVYLRTRKYKIWRLIVVTEATDKKYYIP